MWELSINKARERGNGEESWDDSDEKHFVLKFCSHSLC